MEDDTTVEAIDEEYLSAPPALNESGLFESTVGWGGFLIQYTSIPTGYAAWLKAAR